MGMNYDGALVMPSSYVLMDEEEMTYTEGGKTTSYTGKLSAIKTRLNTVKTASLAGLGGSALIGLGVGSTGAIIAGAVAGALTGNWFSNVSSICNGALAKVKTLINKYGKSKIGKMKTVWSGISVVSISVSV